MSTAEHLLYEFPCNEKIRTYLRLEALFQRFDWFCEQTSAIAHQAGISALFDLLDATARSDLRHELIQELERQRQRLIAKNASADPDMAAHLAFRPFRILSDARRRACVKTNGCRSSARARALQAAPANSTCRRCTSG